MVLSRMEKGPTGRQTEMCQASTEFVPKTESDDEFKWEEFFGKFINFLRLLLFIVHSTGSIS